MLNKATIVLLAWTLWFSAAANAQNITGTITGELSDPSGAKIVGASVAALNVNTGIVYRTKPTEAGVYVLPLLPVGEYQVTVEAANFKAFVRTGLALGAAQRLRVDVVLEVGSVSERVQVSAEAPLVQAEQVVRGGSITPSQFLRLPVGRNPMALLNQLPGVQAAANSLVTGNINGSRDAMTDFKIDGTGATTTNLGYQRVSPIEELIEEVVVQTANYSAEFGRGATQVNVTTRAGTNEFHGVLFHYFGNSALNANSFMNNVYGTSKPVVRSNLFGGVISGPVVVPRVYNGHNRTFFTFGYEGTRNRGAGQNVPSVPTAAMRDGDFSGMATVFDPATTQPVGSGFGRTPFAQNRVPVARFDPVAMKMLENSYPLPNQPGLANNYVFTGPTDNRNDATNVRVDHNLNDRNRLTTRYTYRRNPATALPNFPGPAGAGSNSFSLNTILTDHVVSTEHTYVIRPNLINTFRFGYFYDRQPKGGPGTFEDWPAKLGLKNVASDKFPLVGIQSLTSFGGSNLADPQTTSLNFDFVDSLFLIHGRHSIRAGGECRKLRERLWQPGASSGNISFNTLPTMNPLTRLNGIGFASFLLGIPSSSSLVLYPARKDFFGFSWNYYAGYVQDDVRVSSKLTLNLGMRWEMTTGRKESQNRQSNFNLSTLEFQYTGQNGFPETLYAAPRRNFQPRIGLAYAPFGGTRTVIRAGYGIFFAAPNTYGDPYTTGPWSRSYNYVSLDNGITFPLTLREGFPPVSFNDPYVLSPLTGVGWLPRNYLDGYMQQWGLNIQREVFRQTLVEIGYVGTRGTHLKMGSYELNQVPANLLGPGDAQSRRPYPTRGSISAMYLPIGNSTYHALQARFERRFQRGLAFQGAYTFSKSIDDCSGFASNSSYGVTSVQDNYNLRAERSVSGFDRTQNFAWNFSWELPAGKDRRWLNRGGWLNAVAGGWNLAAIMSTLSGLPPLMGTVQNLTGALGGGSRPNRLRNGKLSGEERGRLRWFDATAFALPAPFTFGSTSRTEPQLREPGSFGLTMLLAKEFSFGEKRRLELRSEWGNALNHFNPGGPNTTIGHAAVGTIVSGNAGRSISLALRLHY